jgi:AraC-like DNA-binding protein
MAFATDTSSAVHLSTHGVPPAERAHWLCRLRERGLLPIEPLAGHRPGVTLTKRFLPGASLLSATLTGVRQHGTASDGATDELLLGVNVSGHSTLRQADREMAVGPGDATVLHLAGGPFTFLRPDRVRFVGVRVRGPAIAPRLPGWDERPRLIPATTATLSLLTSYVRALLASEAPGTPALDRLVVDHVLDLVALALAPGADTIPLACRQGVRAARLEAIKADVEANLGDPALTIAAVAGRQGVTPRYVHRLFETEGVTYGRFVLHRRLDRVQRLLGDPSHAGRTVASLAYDSGFADLSSFNRAFRRRFGATPSEVRATRSDGVAH